MDDGPLYERDADQDARRAPSSVDFGSMTVGASPKSTSVTVTNTGASRSRSRSRRSWNRDRRVDRRGLLTGLSIAPKATCTVGLSYAPPSAATMSAHLDIESDADVSPVVVPLQGTAVAPPSGVTWGSNNNAGPAYTWNGGGALARTVQSGTQRLHSHTRRTVSVARGPITTGPMSACTTSAARPARPGRRHPSASIPRHSTQHGWDSRPPARVSTRRGSARRSG